MTAIAIAMPSRTAYSETFVHQQVRGLPFEVHCLYGGNLPTHRALGLDGLGYAFPGENADPWIRVQAIAEYLRAQQVRAVMAQYGPTGVEMMAACSQAGIPLLVHFHGYDAWRDDVLASYGRRYPALLTQAQAVVGVSREMCAQLERLGAPAGRVHHVAYGVDTRRFSPAATESPTSAEPRFLMVGRQVDKKGHLPALLAFAELLRQFPACTLRIVGSGPLQMAGEMLARSLGIAAKVVFLGALAPDAVAQELQSARALVQFSLTTPSGDREGTPLAVLEAMACGVPVIGSRHAGIPDVIEHGVHGLLVDPFDVAALSSAMAQLAANPSLASALGQAGCRRVRAHYSEARYLGDLTRLVQAAIDQPDMKPAFNLEASPLMEPL